MTKIQFRFKAIKLLGKIRISIAIPLKIRFKLSWYITWFAGLFIKFDDPPENIMFRGIIELAENEDIDGNEDG